VGQNNAHTIGMLVKDSLFGYVNVINETMCTGVLWLYINKAVIGHDFILGSVYIPHQASPVYDNDVFDKMSQDMISFRTRFKNSPTGDFNARTGICSDFLESDSNLSDNYCDNEILLSKFKLESQGIDTGRYSQDVLINNNGRKLLEFCQINDIHIVNGRFGADCQIGQPTCKGVSVVDYVLASSELLSSVREFEVDAFDSLLSDIHCPICLTLSSIADACNENPSATSTKTQSNVDECNNRVKCTNVNWNKDLCTQYKSKLNVNRINELISDVDSMNIDTATVDTINVLNSEMNKLKLSPAVQMGMVKTGKTQNSNKNTKRPNQNRKNAWYNDECKKVRCEYLSLKKEFKKDQI
jgi:hypothetical protein